MTLDDSWRRAARLLADQITEARPAWYAAVAETPRHILVPQWWIRDLRSPLEEWDLVVPSNDAEHFNHAYADKTLITRVGPVHADHAEPGDRPSGAPTSSSTLPGLIVEMLDRLAAEPDDLLLDIGTGSGYSAALMAHRFGDNHVTSVDVDPYLTSAARERLERLGRTPAIDTVDATGPLPGQRFDRIMATVSARPIPLSWLESLAPKGRLVTTIAGTDMLIIADKQPGMTAIGRIDTEPANFMPTRHDLDYPARRAELYKVARDSDGDDVRPLKRAIPDLWKDWELRNLYELDTPDVEIRTAELDNGCILMWLLGDDGSWARAESEPGLVHQAGPRRLWDNLERVEQRWETAGRFPLHSMTVRLTPDGGTLTAPNGTWAFAI